MKLRNEIVVGNRKIGRYEPVYIIAEMACAHQGDLDQAYQLIDSAVAAKADCIQLQFFDTDANMSPHAESYSLLQQLSFNQNEWESLVSYTRKFDIHLSIFAYDEPSIDLALRFEPDMLKLNSSELSNPLMIEAAARSGLPFTMGTGASTLEEIRKAVEIAIKAGNTQLILMHGMQNFPTDLAAANVGRIKTLKDIFGGQVVYADHTDANMELSHWVDYLAIGLGASMLEKHIIMDRNASSVDWQAALEPQEFVKYVEQMRMGKVALGDDEFSEFTDSEIKYRKFQKKSLVASRDIAVGELICDENVSFLRVQSVTEGVSPMLYLEKLKGKTVNRAISQFEQITEQDLQ